MGAQDGPDDDAGETAARDGGRDAEGVPDGEARRRRLLARVAGEPVGQDADGVPPSGPRARLARLCTVSVAELGVTEAGVTVMGSIDAGLAGHRDQLWATGVLARHLEDLQLTTGEGPCLDAYDTGAPALAGDLQAQLTRWVGFGPEAIAAGAAAVFSLPLQVGAVRLGTLDLCRDRAGALSHDELADALVMASLATETLLELVGDPQPAPDVGDGASPGVAGLLSETVGWLPDVHAEVHQASGMVSAQEDIGVAEALLRIRGHAYAQNEPIDEVARRVIGGDLVLPDRRGREQDDRETGPEGPESERD